MVEAVLATTEKILRERLDGEKHARLIDEFLARVQTGEAPDGSTGETA